MQWWDIIYTFSWRTTYALWTSYGGIQGQTLNGPGYIPWNCDWYIGADVGLLGGAIGGFLLPGWYEMTFEQPTNPIISFNTRRKYLDAEDPALPINKAGLVAGANHPFDQLFLIQAPDAAPQAMRTLRLPTSREEITPELLADLVANLRKICNLSGTGCTINELPTGSPSTCHPRRRGRSE